MFVSKNTSDHHVSPRYLDPAYTGERSGRPLACGVRTPRAATVEAEVERQKAKLQEALRRRQALAQAWVPGSGTDMCLF